MSQVRTHLKLHPLLENSIPIIATASTVSITTRITPYITVHIPLTTTTAPITTIPTNPPPTSVLAPFFFVPPLVVAAVELLPLVLAGAVGAKVALGLAIHEDATLVAEAEVDA